MLSVPTFVSRQAVPPSVLAAVLVLVVSVVAFWSYRTGMFGRLDTARLSKTKAKMHDATCTFVADFKLQSVTDQGAFAVHSEKIRREIVVAMRTKSKYMVETPQGQKGLRLQFANLANRIAGKRIATAVTFEQFTLN